MSAVVSALMKFPEAIVVAATEPTTGLPARLKWLPSIAEVIEACEAEMPKPRPSTPIALAAPKPTRPTSAELDQQFKRLNLQHLRTK